jgi:hypothetical protein
MIGLDYETLAKFQISDLVYHRWIIRAYQLNEIDFDLGSRYLGSTLPDYWEKGGEIFRRAHTIKAQ